MSPVCISMSSWALPLTRLACGALWADRWWGRVVGITCTSLAQSVSFNKYLCLDLNGFWEAPMEWGQQEGREAKWTLLLECAEKFCYIHPGPVHAGQDDGEPSHKGRTRAYEQNCELGVGEGQEVGRGGGLTTDRSGLVRREGESSSKSRFARMSQRSHSSEAPTGCVCVCVCVYDTERENKVLMFWCTDGQPDTKRQALSMLLCRQERGLRSQN